MLPVKINESLPQKLYSATQVLENEAKVAANHQIAMPELMEKAGLAVFRHIQAHHRDLKNLLVISGKGNNGGDGFVIARLAQESGIQVTVYLAVSAEKISGDALTAYNKLMATNASIIHQDEQQLTNEFIEEHDYQLVVDSLFGIGFKGELRDNALTIVRAVNQNMSAKVIAVDIPSGLQASTGAREPDAIIADETISFIVAKQGLFTGQAAHYVGELFLANLSLGETFEQQVSSNHLLLETHALQFPCRSSTSHKGNIGLLVTFGGNEGMPGAIRMASEAALRSGASLVSVYCHQSNQAMVANGRPELMFTTNENLAANVDKAKVLLCGPGLGDDAWAQQILRDILQQNKPCVLDADALTLLSQQPIFNEHWILTPHPGEAARLLNCSVRQIEQDRFKAVKSIAQQYGGICVLKGAGTLISDGNVVWVNTTGNAGMASGGMGDVLSGIIAALVMQLASPFEAAKLAVYVHGKAADIIAGQQGEIGLLATDLLTIIPQLINQK